MIKHAAPLILILCCLFYTAQSHAQYMKPVASSASVKHAQRVAKVCLGDWKNQACLKAVSESALVMSANYAAKLQAQGKTSYVETLKNSCAASTAAIQGVYPMEAMRSAYIECANIISDINDETGISPDPSHYQLIVAPVLCLQEHRSCRTIEEGLKKYKYKGY